MLLQSIKLENFRQFVSEQIDFSTDPERNVTLIIGENGTGKTTFAQSFFWCLYGETDFTDKIMLNRVVASELTPDKTATVKVVLKLKHGSAAYEITRTQDYKKTYGNKVTPANTVLNIAIRTSEGNTRYLKPLECETEIKKILPKELSSYFFFDGERIEKMSKEIASGKKSSGFANAVIGLTGLKATLTALGHLQPSKVNSVMGKFNADYTGDSRAKIENYTAQINKLQDELDQIDTRLSEIKDEIHAAQTTKEQKEVEVKAFAEGEKLQKEKEQKEKELKAAKNMLGQQMREACRLFNDHEIPFLSMSLVERALKIVSKSDFSGKDIPEMHAKTIDFLLKRGTCICGTHLDPGTIPYTKVDALHDYLPPQSIGVTVGQFVKDSLRMYGNDAKFMEREKEYSGFISERMDAISELEEDIGLITENMSGDDVREQVKQINSQIIACAHTIEAREAERQKLLIRKGGCGTDKGRLEDSRSKLSLLDKGNRKIEICKAYTQRVYDELYAEYIDRENSIRKQLEESINKIFKSIYDGGLSLTIDERYNISVFVTDYEGGVETSTAQSISVIFAFISAIIKMARDNQKENADEGYSEPYPLVMDAPLSAFDKRRIKAICDAIPETAEQVIIFIKDTDGELAESHLGAKVMTRHYFEKIDEFNTRLN